jgi:hypothetical protein
MVVVPHADSLQRESFLIKEEETKISLSGSVLVSADEARKQWGVYVFESGASFLCDKISIIMNPHNPATLGAPLPLYKYNQCNHAIMQCCFRPLEVCPFKV